MAGLGDALRTAILVIVPVGFATAEIVLDRRGLPRAGTGTWILATIVIGPSPILLADVHAPGADLAWPVFAWGLFALPMGHAFRTRLATGVGLLALIAGMLLSATDDNGLILAGIVATFVTAAAVPLRTRAPRLIDVYRVVGIGTPLALFIWITTFEGRFDALSFAFDGGLLGGFVIAGIVVIGAIWLWQDGRIGRVNALCVLIPPGSMLVLLGILVTTHPFSEMVTFVAMHGALLVLLLGSASIDVELGSSPIVNLVVVGLFFQILAILVRISDAISGALALVLIGTVLVAAAIGLERVRRQLLDRF